MLWQWGWAGKDGVRGKWGPGHGDGQEPLLEVPSVCAFQGEDGMKEQGNMCPRWLGSLTIPRCKDFCSMSSYGLRKNKQMVN